jgi:RNA polymerase sigma factor (TIGR02999 family)
MAADRPAQSSAPEPGPSVGELVEDVYGELRRLAEAYVRRERAKSIQATELVHEAYLRLEKAPRQPWKDRTHFLAIAAISMRRLLVERARARAASKRGGGVVQVTLNEELLPQATGSVDLVALDQALERLADLDATQARIVELRYFAGSTVEETAAALAISPATVKRHWTVARAWLFRELQGAGPS